MVHRVVHHVVANIAGSEPREKTPSFVTHQGNEQKAEQRRQRDADRDRHDQAVLVVRVLVMNPMDREKDLVLERRRRVEMEHKAVKEILEKGPNKYWFIYRARYLLWSLLCQGILNDKDIDWYADEFGQHMTIPVDYTAYLVKLTTSRCRPLISELIKDDAYIEQVNDENFNFLRTNQAYNWCMDFAYKQWGWV